MSRPEELRAAIERLAEEYADVLAEDLGTPLLGDWVFVTTFDDAADETAAETHAFTRRAQWTHRTVGLLTMAADDLRAANR